MAARDREKRDADWVVLPRGALAAGASAGGLHSAVLTDTGDVLTFGDNDHGQLGRGGERAHWATAGQLLGWMAGLGPRGGGPRVLQVCAGDKYTVVLAEDGRAYGCGADGRGELGEHWGEGHAPYGPEVRPLSGFAGIVQPVVRACK